MYYEMLNVLIHFNLVLSKLIWPNIKQLSGLISLLLFFQGESGTNGESGAPGPMVSS